MPAIDNSYTSLLPVLRQVEVQVRGALAQYADETDYLVLGRVKTLSSVQDKVETGRYKSLQDLDDLVAFTVIVDLRTEVREAVAYLKRTFHYMNMRGPGNATSEQAFPFDATRVYLRLRVSDPLSPLGTITFEVQVRTILQHAWSKITHPLVYKPPIIDVRGIRLAAELLAGLEGADRTFSTFASTARSVKRISNRRSEELNRIVAEVDRLVQTGSIPSELRPDNAKRFSENIYGLISREAKFSEALEVISAFYESLRPNFPRSVTLVQLAMIALKRASLLASSTGRKKVFYYVTPELESLYPEARSLNPVVSL